MASNTGPDDPRQTADDRLRRVSAGAEQVDIPADEPGADLAPGDLGPPVEADPGRGGRSRVLAVAIGLVALAGFAGIVWYAYNWGIGGPGGEVPVIKAQSEPEKVRPEDPGGMEVPHQDKLVMNEVSPDPDKPQVERLLPPPETPQPPEPAIEEAAAEATVAAGGEPAENGTDGTKTAEEDAAAPAQAEGTEGEQVAAAATPESMEPEMPAPPKSNGTAGGNGPDPEAAEPAAAETAAAEAGTSTAQQPSPAAGTNGSAGTDGIPSVGQLAQADGRYVIQLASLKSRESAESEWTRLQKVHPGLLGDAKLTIQRAEIEDKGTYFRVQTGPFPNRATAEDMCAILEEANQACLVVRR